MAQLVELYGHDARLYLLRCLVDHIDFRDQKSGKDALKVGLLNQELAKVSGRQNFVSIVCQALEQVSITEDFLQVFVKMVKLSLPHQVALALALAHSLDKAVQEEAGKFLKSKLDTNSFNVLPKEMQHDLLYFLQTRDGFVRQRNAMLQYLNAAFPEDEAPAVLNPLMFAEAAGMACFRRPFADTVETASQLQNLGIASQMPTACSAADLIPAYK